MYPKLFKNNKGFTLIEVIIYIALFSLLLGTAFVTAFQLIDNSGKLGIKSTTKEEGNFVIRKFIWALTGVGTITTPFAGTTNNLEVTKYDGNQIEITLVGTKIKIEESTGPDDFITTENVKATELEFEFIPASGAGPAGIKATVKINEIPFTITKYIRK